MDSSTVVGRLVGRRDVPFRTLVTREITAPTVGWVGKAAAKPVSESAYDQVSIDMATISGIVVISRELAQSSKPSAEKTIGRQLVNGTATFIDEQFLDPSVAAVTDANPASITNGATTHASSGASAAAITADLSLLVDDLTDGDVHLRAPYWIMRPLSAVSLALLRLTDSGRDLSLGGIPILTSAGCPAGQVVLLDAAEILVADEGEMQVDRSESATLDMSGGNSPTFSLFQKNSVGVRIDRRIAWKRAKDAAVAYLTACAW